MQEQEEQEITPESPKPVLETDPEVIAPPLVENGMEEPSKPSGRLRKVLLWSVGLILIFAAGVVLSWVMQVRPQNEQIANLEAEILSAQEQVDLLDKEVKELRPVAELSSQLKEELSSATAHLDLLRVLVDVTTAQLALAQEDDIAARAALTGTTVRLDALAASLEGANASEARDMGGRLKLVLEEVQSDSFAARRDLEILANNLLALERILFGE